MSTARVTRFTRQEVEERSYQGYPTIIINNVVYDVTSFMDQHPGGASRLFEVAGEDASQRFYDAGHSSYAVESRELFRMGVVVERERLPEIGLEQEEPQLLEPRSPRVVVETDVLAAARRLIWFRRRRTNDRRPVLENNEMLDEACKVLMTSFMVVTTLIAVASNIYRNLSRDLFINS